MKYNELNKYIVKCKWEANVYGVGDEISCPSGDKEHNLADFKEELKVLFESCEDVDIKEISAHLKSVFRDFKSIEPIA